MNIKEYIESGILEAYVTGSVSEQERREVQCLSSVYPEIKQELNSIEETMAQFSREYTVPAPAHIKANIMAAIAQEEQIPALKSISQENEPKDSETNDTDAPKRRKDPARFPWRMAATILLLVSSGLLYFLITLEDDYKSEIETQRENLTHLQNQIDEISRTYTDKSDQLALITKPGTLKIPLNPASESFQGTAIVFWDSSNKDVYLDPAYLPTINEDQQYQLWALLDGKPIDLGTVLKGDIGFQKMKNTEEADAFAITLEPIGGSEAPTLEQLKVIAEI